jgi:tetratricopeptide (TPR) repeat protein
MPMARDAALHAVALDPELDAAHVTLGNVRLLFDWDCPAAERAYRRALDINPNSPAAHLGYATYLATLGRFDEAIARVQQGYRSCRQRRAARGQPDGHHDYGLGAGTHRPAYGGQATLEPLAGPGAGALRLPVHRCGDLRGSGRTGAGVRVTGTSVSAAVDLNPVHRGGSPTGRASERSEVPGSRATHRDSPMSNSRS